MRNISEMAMLRPNKAALQAQILEESYVKYGMIMLRADGNQWLG